MYELEDKMMCLMMVFVKKFKNLAILAMYNSRATVLVH